MSNDPMNDLNTSKPELHYPDNIQLRSWPLVEAWLDIRWELEPHAQMKDLLIDTRFPFALGVFYGSVKEKYGRRRDLALAAAPLEISPFIVRHQFLKDDEKGLLQLGPGIAVLNHLKYIDWQSFHEDALYLRQKLLAAYEDNLKVKQVFLAYRNVFPMQFSRDNALAFLSENLHTRIELPRFVPGEVSNVLFPAAINLSCDFELRKPDESRGSLRIATANLSQENRDNTSNGVNEILLLDLTVFTHEGTGPDLSNEAVFSSWLWDAHTVIHEWFFAFIDGNLRARYSNEG